MSETGNAREPAPHRREPASILAQMWQQGQRPDVGDVLRQAGPVSRTQIVAALCFDQWQRWQSGERVPAESHLKMRPEIGSAEEAFDLVFGEFLLREELGENPSLDEYLSRFPQFADQLRRQHELHMMIGSESPSIIEEGARTMTDPVAKLERPTVPKDPSWPDVPGYEILGELGQGGMGTVYKARHMRLSRMVALKLINTQRLADHPQAVSRFVREAQAAARLNHANIVVVYDCDEVADTYFIAMEYVEGVDLYHLVRDSGPLRIEEACNYIHQAAMGLQHAFEQGMVHRDIKPNNLLVTMPRPTSSKAHVLPDAGSDIMKPYSPRGLSSLGTTRPGIVKILDMGLALVPAEGEVSHWTMEGTLMGTPDYIAPEQALNCHAVDVRADLYSLGCTFYFLLTGKPPFAEHHLLQKLMMHQAMPPRAVEKLRPDVPAALSRVVHKLLEKRPEDRYQTPADLALALQMFEEERNMPGTVMMSDASMPAIPAVPRSPDTPRSIERPRESETPKSIIPWRGEAEAPKSIIPWRDAADAKSMVPMREKAPEPAAPAKSEPPEAQKRELARTPSQLPRPTTPLPQPTPPPMHAAAPSPRPAPPPEAETGARKARKIAVLEGHRGWVTAVTYSPNRCYLASGGVDGALRIWDLAGTEPEDRNINNAHASDISAVAFSPDSKLVASGAATLDGLIWLWDLGKNAQARTYIQAPKATVDALCFSPDGRILVAGGSDKNVRLWDISDTPRVMTTLKGHADFVSLVVYSPDGVSLASASREGTVRFWNPGKLWAKEQAVLEGGWGQVFSIAFSPDGSQAAFGALDRKVYLFDMVDGRPRNRAILQDHVGVVRLVHFSSKGQKLVSVCDSGKVVVRHLDSNDVVEWQLPRARACSLAITHDARYLATGNSDGSVTLFRLYDSSKQAQSSADQSHF